MADAALAALRAATCECAAAARRFSPSNRLKLRPSPMFSVPSSPGPLLPPQPSCMWSADLLCCAAADRAHRRSAPAPGCAELRSSGVHM
jgi:hypothetical protein